MRQRRQGAEEEATLWVAGSNALELLLSTSTCDKITRVMLSSTLYLLHVGTMHRSAIMAMLAPATPNKDELMSSIILLHDLLDEVGAAVEAEDGRDDRRDDAKVAPRRVREALLANGEHQDGDGKGAGDDFELGLIVRDGGDALERVREVRGNLFGNKGGAARKVRDVLGHEGLFALNAGGAVAGLPADIRQLLPRTGVELVSCECHGVVNLFCIFVNCKESGNRVKGWGGEIDAKLPTG